MQIRELHSAIELEQCYPIMKELRENLSYEDFTTLYQAARDRDDYTIVGAFDGEKLVAVMGYRILFDFVHEKHLYIDDLVTTAECRSMGFGAKLLEHAEALAKKFECKGLRLCTGVDRKDSQRFYERHNWKARAIAYKKPLT